MNVTGWKILKSILKHIISSSVWGQMEIKTSHRSKKKSVGSGDIGQGLWLYNQVSYLVIQYKGFYELKTPLKKHW